MIRVDLIIRTTISASFSLFNVPRISRHCFLAIRDLRMSFLLEDMKKEAEKFRKWNKYYKPYTNEEIKNLDLVEGSFTHINARENPEFSKKRKKLHNNCKVPIVCVETGQVFSSIREAASHVGLHPTTFAMYMKQNKGKVKGFSYLYK